MLKKQQTHEKELIALLDSADKYADKAESSYCMTCFYYHTQFITWCIKFSNICVESV